jgi:hypothetical protein
MKVFVYFNLHRKVFSIKALEGPSKGRVIGHAHTVALRDVTAKVSQAGRERVLREQKKNVHAGMVGELDATRGIDYHNLTTPLDHWAQVSADMTDALDVDLKPGQGEAVTYNPYKYDSFVTVDGERAITGADYVVLSVKGQRRGVYAEGVTYRDNQPTEPTTVTLEKVEPMQAKAKQPKAKSSVIYRGPSLIDGAPIVAVAIVKSGNSKTGNMVQTYIMREDMTPCEASKTGADYSICGDCPHRGEVTTDPKRKQAKNRLCYVVLGQGPTIVHKGLQRDLYPDVTGHDAIANLGAGRMVRLGTYGDPAAVPSYVWESLLTDAKGHTAYTHQSGHVGADHRPDLFMVSADSEEAAQAAWERGERTFRLIASTGDRIPSREVLCPASEEAGRRTTCDKCKLCAGASIAAKSVAIVAHGAGAKNFTGR